MTDRDVALGRRAFVGAGLVGGLALGAGPAQASRLLAAGTGHDHVSGCLVCASCAAGGLGGGAAFKPRPAVSLPLGSSAAALAAATRGAIIIRPSWVLVAPGGRLDVVADQEVVVEDGRIAEVRPVGRGTDNVVEAPGQLLVPGFISGHSHSAAGTLTRGWIEENGSVDRSGPHRGYFKAMALIDSLTDEELDDLTALNVAEMVRGGCTTQVELSLSLRQVQSYVRVIRRYGLRGYAAGMVPNMSNLGDLWYRGLGKTDVLRRLDGRTIGEIAENLAFAKSVHGADNGRVQMMMGVAVTPVFTETSFAAILAAAKTLGTGTHVHVESGTDSPFSNLLHEYWGKGEADILKDQGFLGQRMFGAHLAGLENPARDLQTLRSPNFTFAHCPSAAGAGQRPSTQIYPEALAAGVNTAIGFDTHSNDYVENIKLAVIGGRARALLLAKDSKIAMKEPTIWDGLNSATLAPANGLGRADLGRIEAGARADLSTIDVSGFFTGNGGRPREPWNNLLYANGNNVRSVMIDGEWKVRDGQIGFADPAALQARGAKAAQRIWDKLEADGFFVKMRT